MPDPRLNAVRNLFPFVARRTIAEQLASRGVLMPPIQPIKLALPRDIRLFALAAHIVVIAATLVQLLYIHQAFALSHNAAAHRTRILLAPIQVRYRQTRHLAAMLAPTLMMHQIILM